MAVLTAPPVPNFPTVDQGTYIGVVKKIETQDFTEKPDNFGKTGYHQFIFHWVLEGVETEDGQEIELFQYVRFMIGDKPSTKGVRAGRIPLLTEITRSFGEPDIQAGDPVDTDMWLGKRAKLGVLFSEAEKGPRNSINSVGPAAKKNPTTAKPATRVVSRPTPPVTEEEDEEAISF